jgi:hypothetical protein
MERDILLRTRSVRTWQYWQSLFINFVCFIVCLYVTLQSHFLYAFRRSMKYETKILFVEEFYYSEPAASIFFCDSAQYEHILISGWFWNAFFWAFHLKMLCFSLWGMSKILHALPFFFFFFYFEDEIRIMYVIGLLWFCLILNRFFYNWCEWFILSK